MSEARLDRFCAIGLLAMEAAPGAEAQRLKDAARRLEGELRARYGAMAREELKALAPFPAYAAYYRAFGHSYHVLPQLESVARGKPIPDAPPPVVAMFMAELKNGVLTAGHDLDAVRPPLGCRSATGEETYAALNGSAARCAAGDWLIEDREGVLSSILKGPDRRTAITRETRRVLYAAYAPEGVAEEALSDHLDDIEAAVRLFSGSPAPVFRGIVRVGAGGASLWGGEAR